MKADKGCGSMQSGTEGQGASAPTGGAVGRLPRLVTRIAERSRSQRDAVAALAVRVGGAGIMFLSQIALARWIGGHDYGIYVFIWTTVLLLGGLSHAGLNIAMIRLLPLYRETGQLELMRGLVLGGRLFVLALSLALSIGMVAMLWFSAGLVDEQYLLPLMLAMACVPAYTLTDVQDGIGRSQGWMSMLLAPYIVRPLAVLAFIGGAHEAGLHIGATAAAVAAVAATWSAFALQTAMLEAKLAFTIPSGPRRIDLPAWLTASMPLLAMGSAEIILQNADTLTVAHYLTPIDAGIYFAAAKTMSLSLFVLYATGSAFGHRFAALEARNDAAGLRAAVREATLLTFWPTLAVVVVLLGAGVPILSMFGSQFTEGYPVMVVLAGAFLARAALGPAEALLNAVGEQQACARSLGVAAVLDVGLNVLLVPMYGLMGGAIATAVALVSASVLNREAARRKLGYDIGVWALLLPARRLQVN